MAFSFLDWAGSPRGGTGNSLHEELPARWERPSRVAQLPCDAGVLGASGKLAFPLGLAYANRPGVPIGLAIAGGARSVASALRRHHEVEERLTRGIEPQQLVRLKVGIRGHLAHHLRSKDYFV